ncbi:hypothetical protein VitviT2T_010048 [Vitis vinifera]|uniref:Retrotransposon gag domain-containing protein n=1 Tax=Vitis vinifera TaxID=29760 RepID=A0ABY9C6J1_VITVI|nr:hypothetical protein VitviT2T_010048 [Vitis vinifera]
MIDPLPSITKVFALVGQEERQWVISHVILPFSDSSVIGNLNSNFVNTSVSATKGKRDRPLCTHYNIPGHTVDKCYKLNGYLPGYKFKPKGKPTKIHINQASSSVGDGIVTPSSEISLDTLTANQCKQLLTFLSSQLQLNSSSTLDLQRMYNLLDHLCLVLVSSVTLMATNKERIEQLEARLGGLQDGMSRMELGLTDKLHQMEETIHRLSEALLSNKEGSSSNTNDRNGRVRNNRDNSKEQMGGGQQMFLSKLAKLEFPRYSSNDPTEWFNKVDQFFEYQGIPAAQKVSLSSFHLESEASQWWQWLRRSYSEEGKEVAWVDFEEELWARFGPTECEDFDEALSRVKQMGSLQDYQREFEKLGNRVQGWTQKALVGTFMGGLMRLMVA